MQYVNYGIRLIGRMRDEAGYSLVEVMVAIMIMTIAIIPMVGMFDAGLRTAVLGGNYDKARTLANKQLEIAKGLPYATVRDNFPTGTGAPDDVTGTITSSDQTDAEFPGFTYKVRKDYAAIGPSGIAPNAAARNMMQITVTVNWQGKSYSTTGLVSKET